MQKKIEIDEEAIIASMAPSRNKDKSVLAKVDDPSLLDEVYESSAHTAPTEPVEPSTDTADARRTVKQRQSDLDGYRRHFMQTPRIEDRKPVFISRSTRDRLDRIVRLLGERGMSVSGLVENLARHHLAAHESDIECWRKL